MTAASLPSPKPPRPPDPLPLDPSPLLAPISLSKPEPHPPPLALFPLPPLLLDSPPPLTSPPPLSSHQPFTDASWTPLIFSSITSPVVAYSPTIPTDLFGTPRRDLLSLGYGMKTNLEWLRSVLPSSSLSSFRVRPNPLLLRRFLLSPELVMPHLKPNPPDPPDPPDLSVLSSQSLCSLIAVDRVPPLPSFGLKPWSLLVLTVSVSEDIHNSPFYSVLQVCDHSPHSDYSTMVEICLEWMVLELWFMGVDCDVPIILVPFCLTLVPSSDSSIVVVGSVVAGCRFIIASMRPFTEIFSLCPNLFMDSCVICWASLPWCEGVLPTKSLVPEMLVPVDMYCLFFPKVPLSLSGLVDQDSSVLQGISSRCFVLPVFVAGFFSAFVADIFSGFSSESNALTSVSDAADQDIHGILVFFDSSCFLLIKCIYFYHVYLASWLANLWFLFMNYLVTPPLLMEFY